MTTLNVQGEAVDFLSLVSKLITDANFNKEFNLDTFFKVNEDQIVKSVSNLKNVTCLYSLSLTKSFWFYFLIAK